MATTTLKIDVFDADSVEKAVAQMSSLAESFGEGDIIESNIINSLLDEGVETVAQNLASADVDGNYFVRTFRRAPIPFVGGRYGLEDTVLTARNGDEMFESQYIEFGTGTAGVGKYPDQTALAKTGYRHGDRNSWYYTDKVSGRPFQFSRGLEPQAPLYNSFISLRSKVRQIAKRVVDKEFNRAFHS